MLACTACQRPCATTRNPCVCGNQQFTIVDERNIDDTLVASLTPMVDAVRDLYTTLGARQYQVSLVWTRWSGGQRGVGAEFLVLGYPLLPTPMVSDLSNIRQELTQIGLMETGNLKVSEISPRFNEDLLVGRDLVVKTGDPVPPDMSFFWEVFFPRSTSAGMRRRFVPGSAPNKNPTNFEWTISLIKAGEDRNRDGTV